MLLNLNYHTLPVPSFLPSFFVLLISSLFCLAVKRSSPTRPPWPLPAPPPKDFIGTQAEDEEELAVLSSPLLAQSLARRRPNGAAEVAGHGVSNLILGQWKNLPCETEFILI